MICARKSETLLFERKNINLHKPYKPISTYEIPPFHRDNSEYYFSIKFQIIFETVSIVLILLRKLLSVRGYKPLR